MTASAKTALLIVITVFIVSLGARALVPYDPDAIDLVRFIKRRHGSVRFVAVES